MTKKGIFVNGKKVADVKENTKISIINGADSLSNNSIRSPEMINQGYVNQGVHNGDIDFLWGRIVETEKKKGVINNFLIIDDEVFDLSEFSNSNITVNIEVHGDVSHVSCENSNVTISSKGNVGKIQSKNGNVDIVAKMVETAEAKIGNVNIWTNSIEDF